MARPASRRLSVLLVVLFLIGGAIALRLFILQVKERTFWRGLADDQHRVARTLFPRRGEIFFQDLSQQRQAKGARLFPVAANKNGHLAYAVPKDIPAERLDTTVMQLASLLQLDQGVLRERLAKRADPYEPVKHRLRDEESESLQRLNLDGVRLGEEIWRYYPAQELAGFITGFAGFNSEDQRGLYGLERHYETILAGKSGYLAAERDAFGGFLPFRIHKRIEAEDGANLVLTIDTNIQFVATEKLRAVLKKWSATGGTMIVLEPKTGRILAMVSEPSYDPNGYNKVQDIGRFQNPAVEHLFEPGSVFKPVTMAAGLEERMVTPDTTYTDTGEVRIGGYVIRNFDNKARGVQTMSQVIELSLNTGAVFVQQQLGNSRFAKYVTGFGFGAATGVDLPGELAGNVKNLSQKADVNYAAAAFGQGVGVTSLQMANAIAAIANDGKLMRPYLVERIEYADGRTVTTAPKVIRQVVSSQAARMMSAILVNAVRGKFERRADVPGYFVAGKTGTAQIPDLRSGGYLPVSEGVIHSFVGYAPAFNPRFLVFIKMDRPKGVMFASNSLTPVFHDMAVYLLNYFTVPPDEPAVAQQVKTKQAAENAGKKEKPSPRDGASQQRTGLPGERRAP